MRNVFIRTTTMSVFALMIAGFSSAAAAQQAPATEEHAHGQAQETDSAPPPAESQMMMQMQAQMMERMRAADTSLQALVASMKSAQGQEAKVDAMVELLTALVSTQSAMHRQMLQLHDSMMKQMNGGMMQKK